MNIFIGKRYRYKNKIIGVLDTMNLNFEVYMIGHIKPSGSLKRVKVLPLFLKIEEAQKALDEFAKARGLAEA